MSWNEEKLIHTFNGIRFTTRSSLELLNSLVSFDAREDDILLVSYPKSGTHWLAEILTHIYASKVALTSPIEFGDLSKLDQLNRLSCKRIIPTHLDSNLLPPTFRVKHCKAIYIVRNPKDIAVSMFHYYQENPNLPTIDSWPNFLEMFLKGDVVCGSWFDHVLSWEKHLHEKNILFLFYEDMKKDLPKVVKKLSAFLGLNPSESQIYEICKRASFNEMKTNTERENSDQSHTVCVLTSNRKLIFRKEKNIPFRRFDEVSFIILRALNFLFKAYFSKQKQTLGMMNETSSKHQKGTVGDWKNHFTPKQNRLFEETFKKKMTFSEVAKHLIYEC